MSDVVKQLRAVPGLRLQCPCCEHAFLVAKAPLFDVGGPYPSVARRNIAARQDRIKETIAETKTRRKELAAARRHKPQRIETTSEASNFGQISEQIIPALGAFPYAKMDCRLLLKPIDYLVFEGLTKRSGVEEIKFVEVKTGGGRLTPEQQATRQAIADGEVKYRVLERAK